MRCPTSLPEFQPQEQIYHPELRRLAQMDEESYRRTFRGSPVKRAKYSGVKRNVAIAWAIAAYRNLSRSGKNGE